MNVKHLLISGMVAAIAGGTAVSAWGTTIVIDNPGFDYTALSGPNNGVTNPLGTYVLATGSGVTLNGGGGGTADFLGWNGTGSSGAQTFTTIWNGTLPTGSTGFVNKGSNGLVQPLSGEYQPDTIYTLTVDLYERSGALGLPATIRVELWSGLDPFSGGANLGGTLTIPAFVSGYSTAALVFTTDSSVTPGSDMSVFLGASDPGAANKQINFDNVALGAVEVPEPSTLGLVGCGALALLGLGSMFRLRRVTGS